MTTQQRGGTLLGIILGLVLGLGAALAVALYVTKVPVPFMNKGAMRPGDQEEAEAQKNKNWDPNAPLYGKNPARPAVPTTVTPEAPSASATASTPASAATAAAPAVAIASAPRSAASTEAKVEPKTAKSDSKTPDPKADPLGDLVKSKSGAASTAASGTASVDPFDYFVQAGAFRTQSDAEAQRAKLAMMGWEARVSEREQNGRSVFRVRIGPFAKRDDAGDLKDRLGGLGVESNLVRVQR